MAVQPRAEMVSNHEQDAIGELYSKKLAECRGELVRKMKMNEAFLSDMMKGGILSFDEKTRLSELMPNREFAAGQLLNIIQKAGNDAFVMLVNALVTNGEESLAMMLDSELCEQYAKKPEEEVEAFIQHRSTLVCKIDLNEVLLSHMLKDNVLSLREKKKIDLKKLSTPDDAAGILLDVVQSKGLSALRLIVEALIVSDQRELAYLLNEPYAKQYNERRVNSDIEMTVQQRRALTECMPLLVKHLDVSPLFLAEMQGNDSGITLHNVQEIENENLTNCRNTRFLTIMQNRGRQTFDHFLRALDATEQADLRRELNKVLVRQEKNAAAVELSPKHPIIEGFSKDSSFPANQTTTCQSSPSAQEVTALVSHGSSATSAEAAATDGSPSAFDRLIHGEIPNSVGVQCISQSSSGGDAPVLTSLMGHLSTVIHQADYYKICRILSSPEVKSSQRNGFVGRVFNYLVQKIKMRGCSVLEPSRLRALIVKDGHHIRSARSYLKGHVQRAPSECLSVYEVKQSEPVSRLDCITCIINAVDDVVARDLLSVMSEFPMALPLVMKTLNNRKYILMTSLLQGILVKWETLSGIITEHFLFCNPFRMIVAVRLGNHKVGKSTILNQLFTKDYMFSCCGEAGCEYGKPLSLEGSVEFVWLTRETSKDVFWNSILSKHYSETDNEIALLANMHGNATNHLDILSVLNQFSCHYLIFLMPDYTAEQLEQLLAGINCTEARVSFITVDPPDFSPCDPDAIQTYNLSSDIMIEKVRERVGDALSRCFRSSATQYVVPDNGCFVPLTKTTLSASQRLINFVEKNSCKGTKETLELQAKRLRHENARRLLNNNSRLMELLDIFSDILFLPPAELQTAVLHAERELSRLSNIDSLKARFQVCLLKNQLKKKVTDVKSNNIDEKEFQDSISKALEQLGCMSLGFEHFIREIAQVYESVDTESGSKRRDKGQWHEFEEENCWYKRNERVRLFPEKMATLILNGNPFELLDGDASDIPLIWFNAVCKEVTRFRPKLRVFVISIIGLQSSGKSTLLNSLFACRFAVSVGRCTRGLFMRLLFLDDDLAKTHHFDAILLIDSEGLGSPEKMNDTAAEKRDRLLATFAMGISNLTVINVLGENLKEITEILQIAILTMTRLEKADISPDILMVQHQLTEKNSAKTLEEQNQFRQAILSAAELSVKKDIQCGVRDDKRLFVLNERINNHPFLLQFHPFKDGASVNSAPSEGYHQDVVSLYEMILETGRTSKTIIQFKKWHELVESYWNFVTQEDFALHFKNINEVYEFIDRGNKIAVVKQAFSDAFDWHSKTVNETIMPRVKDASQNDGQRLALLEVIEHEISAIPVECKDCKVCKKALDEQCCLYADIENKPCEQETKSTIDHYRQQCCQSTIKQLSQKMHGLIVQQGCCNLFDNAIERHLRESLNQYPTGIPSEDARRNITEAIFTNLRTLANERLCSTGKLSTIRQTLIVELQTVYHSIYPCFVQDFNKDARSFEDIIQEKSSEKNILYKALKKVWGHMDKHYDLLKRSLNALPEKILERRDADCYAHGMGNEMYLKINELLHSFTAHTLSSNDKYRIHVSAQQTFCAHMEAVQAKWDRNNNPSMILDQHEERYKSIIITRLKYGFSCAAEGRILGDDLWAAIRQDAIISEDAARIAFVMGHVWITNSEKVRLKFFSEIVQEVRNGDNARALKYFRNPKKEIEKWFKTRVDDCKNGNAKCGAASRSTFTEQFSHVLSIVSGSKDTVDCVAKLKSYLELRGITYSQSIDLSDTRQEDHGVLKQAITERLEELKKQQPEIGKDSYSLPSTNNKVLSCLGCTEQCPRCGALCWGQRGHDENKDDTKKHHTSHQAGGLCGIIHKDTKCLRPLPCSDMSDGHTIYYGEYRDNGKLWKNAKEEDYSHWKFDKHHNMKFDKLMRWFFWKLHSDIAAQLDVSPATDDDLEKNDCTSELDIETILHRIEQEVS